MCDLLPASFTSWLSQELSYSQTCVVTIKHPQISIMKHSHTPLSLHNIHLQLTNADLQNNSMQPTFSLSLRLWLRHLTPGFSLLFEGVEPNMTIDSQSPISGECPPPWSLYPDTDTSTSHSSSQHPHSRRNWIFLLPLSLKNKIAKILSLSSLSLTSLTNS